MNKKDEQEIIKQIHSDLKFNKYELAKEKIDNFIYLYGKNCYIELEEAKYYHATNNLKEAKKILFNLIDLNPKNIGYVLYELAKVYESKKEYDKAIETYKKIENTNHKNKNYAYFSMGVIYEKEFKYDEAIECFKKVIFANFDLREKAKFHLARTYFYSKRYDEAKSMFKKVITHNNENLTKLVKYYEVKIEYALGNTSRYEDMIDELLLRYPDFNPLINEKVKILLSNNNYRESKKYMKKIKPLDVGIELDFTNDLVYAEYYEKTCQFDKSLNIYEKILENKIKYNHIDIPRVILGIATSYVGIGKIDEGYEYFLKLYDRNDVYHNIALFNLVTIDLYKGNYEKAYEYYSKIDLANIKESDLKNVEDFKLMFDKLLNIHTVYEKDFSYRRKQIIDYDKQMAVDHINSRHGIENIGDIYGAFSSNIDINKLIDDVKEKLIDENLIRINITNRYRIYHKNVGTFNGDPLDYLVVITMPYSNDIITMYPSDETLNEKMEVIEEVKEKVYKRESQIEKFNRRYNIK